MDTVKVFDNLDRKIERLIDRLKSLESENDKLKNDVAAARKAEKDAGGAKDRLKSLESENEKLKNDLATARKAEKEASGSKSAMEKMEREQGVVRERLEKLIESLEAAEESR
jgi:FtsZ-binding cell division protein ZapB